MTYLFFKCLNTLLFVVPAILLSGVAYSDQLGGSTPDSNGNLYQKDILTKQKTGGSNTQQKSVENIILAMKSLSKKTPSVNHKRQNPQKKLDQTPLDKSSRIARIVATGIYQKKDSKKNILRNKTKKASLKVKATSKKTARKKANNKRHYCLGGSYKALAKKSKKYDKFITKYSSKYNVSRALIKAVITAESCFNAKAVSPKGAQGLMQLMPPTAKRFGIKNSFNPDSNIKGGTRYLQFLLKYFDEDILNAIAAYNAGEGAVNKYKGIPPYRETRLYVRKVAALYKLYSQGGGELTHASLSSLSSLGLAKSIFIPRAMPRSRFSPYKGRSINISHGRCANRTGTRLRKSTMLESGNGIWQRIYKVRKGDTLLRVMQKTGIHKSKIKQMNSLNSRARLKVGRELLVWECRK